MYIHTCTLAVQAEQRWLLCWWDNVCRHVCSYTQQTCLPRHEADMSAVSHSRRVCLVTRQTCMQCHTRDMSAVWDSRHAYLLPTVHKSATDTADVSDVSHTRHVCCHMRQTYLLSDSIPLVYSALAILIPLAACALFASTLILFGVVALHRWEGGPICRGRKGALFLICLQTYKWETAIYIYINIYSGRDIS